MLIGDWLDTLLNLATFGFIAAMVWIYLRGAGQKEQPDDKSPTCTDTIDP